MELKPCPFCGGYAVVFIPESEELNEDSQMGFVLCKHCGFASDVYCDEATIARLWNRRADNG